MSEKLTTALDALKAEVAENGEKLGSAVTAIRSFPEVVAAAVATALENAGVSDDVAAAEIDEARQAMSDQVDAIVAAVSENTAPDGGEDTQAGTGDEA